MTIASLPGPAQTDQYMNLKFLKRGGMGEIWVADDKVTSGKVAIKIVPITDPANLELLTQEGKIAGALNHPHIIAVHHIGIFVDGGLSYFYMAMEYATSGSLADLINKQGNGTSLIQALDYMTQIASGVSEAHKAIVHRDLKPDNILLDATGSLKITDFGLAKYIRDSTRTKTFKGWGTYPYMAPECWLFEDNTPRMDIYSMGIIYFELLAGVKPYTAATENEWRDHHLYDPLPDLRKYRKDAPDRLIDTISKMTIKRAADRYSDVQSILLVLQEIASSVQQGSTQRDPLISKARAAVNEQQAQSLEAKRIRDLAEQQSRLLDTAIDALFVKFSRRIDAINANLEQAKIKYTLDKARKFQAEFLRNRIDIRFFASSRIGNYVAARKQDALQRQKEQYGMLMQEVESSAFEKDAVVLVGVISTSTLGRRSDYGANLLLRKAAPDDLYGEWWFVWFDDSALIATACRVILSFQARVCCGDASQAPCAQRLAVA